MVGVAAAPQRAREDARHAVDELSSVVRKLLEEAGGSEPLHDLLQRLQDNGAAVDTISRALAGLIASDELSLTSGRLLVLRRHG